MVYSCYLIVWKCSNTWNLTAWRKQFLTGEKIAWRQVKCGDFFNWSKKGGCINLYRGHIYYFWNIPEISAWRRHGRVLIQILRYTRVHWDFYCDILFVKTNLGRSSTSEFFSREATSLFFFFFFFFSLFFFFFFCFFWGFFSISSGWELKEKGEKLLRAKKFASGNLNRL